MFLTLVNGLPTGEFPLLISTVVEKLSVRSGRLATGKPVKFAASCTAGR